MTLDKRAHNPYLVDPVRSCRSADTDAMAGREGVANPVHLTVKLDPSPPMMLGQLQSVEIEASRSANGGGAKNLGRGSL